MRTAGGTVITEAVRAGTDKLAAVAFSDTAVLARIRGLYVGGAGDLVVVDGYGTSVTFKAVPAGTLLPISPSKVMATGTTATNVVALM